MNLNKPPELDQHGTAVPGLLLLRRAASPMALALLLAACSGGPERVPPRAPVLPDATQARPSAAATNEPALGRYRLDPQDSMLRILVYRGGPMAQLGHNHVISSRDLQGDVLRASTVEASGFELTVPVNSLVVDDNTERAQEGEDFPLNVSEDAKAGTKANMLRPTLLDGAVYPNVSIRSTGLRGTPDAPVATVAIRIKNQTREMQVPLAVQTQADALIVQGSLEIRQSDFGITPLSIAMGALTVQDTVKIKFRLVARSLPKAP